MYEFSIELKNNGKEYQCSLSSNGKDNMQIVLDALEKDYLNHKYHIEKDTEASTKKMKKLGIKRIDWDKYGKKYRLLEEACYTMYSKNEKLKRELLATGIKKIIYVPVKDENCEGLLGMNLLGIALMEVRERVRKKGLLQALHEEFSIHGVPCQGFFPNAQSSFLKLFYGDYVIVNGNKRRINYMYSNIVIREEEKENLPNVIYKNILNELDKREEKLNYEEGYLGRRLKEQDRWKYHINYEQYCRRLFNLLTDSSEYFFSKREYNEKNNEEEYLEFGSYDKNSLKRIAKICDVYRTKEGFARAFTASCLYAIYKRFEDWMILGIEYYKDREQFLDKVLSTYGVIAPTAIQKIKVMADEEENVFAMTIMGDKALEEGCIDKAYYYYSKVSDVRYHNTEKLLPIDPRGICNMAFLMIEYYLYERGDMIKEISEMKKNGILLDYAKRYLSFVRDDYISDLEIEKRLSDFEIRTDEKLSIVNKIKEEIMKDMKKLGWE